MSVIIWHNPRCSKSRQTLELLQANGVVPIVRHYLEDVPNAEEIASVLHMLHRSPRELMRTNEPEYKELGLSSVEDKDSLIAAMVKTPKLIERPIVINGDKAAVGRPPEDILKVI
jgi:arsenate reductase (glutaredoxin)